VNWLRPACMNPPLRFFPCCSQQHVADQHHTNKIRAQWRRNFARAFGWVGSTLVSVHTGASELQKLSEQMAEIIFSNLGSVSENRRYVMGASDLLPPSHVFCAPQAASDAGDAKV
jgi:hypothetical protein